MEDASEPTDAAAAPPKSRPKRPGPASQLTAELIDEIAGLLARGIPKRQTCALVGLSDSLLGKWLERGREAQRKDEESLQVELVRAVEWAEARYLKKQLDLLHKAATSRKVDYRPVMGVLSRRFKEFATPTTASPGAASESETIGEVLKPEEIEASLAEKLTRFLALHDKRAPQAAPTTEPTTEAGAAP